MPPFLTPLTLIELAIGLTLLEAVVLLLYHRRTGRGLPVPAWLPNLTAGLCLMGALHEVLVRPGGWGLPVWLLLAGAAHVTDLCRRWRAGSD